MKKFDLKKAILENKATFFSSLNENMGLTPLQQYIYDYETDISSPDTAEEELDNIKKFNNLDDVEDYYVNYRGWEDDRDLRSELRNLMRNLAKQFPDLAEGKTETNEGYNEFKRMDKGSKGVTAKNKGEEEVYGAGVKKGEEIEKKKMKMSELKGKIKKMVMAEVALDIDTMENAPKSEVDFYEGLERMLGEESPMNDPRTQQVIDMLIDMEVDGETMEYILRKVGMEDQMANQLVNYPKDYAASLSEAKEDEEEIEVTDEFSTEEPQGKGKIDVTQNADADLTGDKKSVQDNLEAALEAAKSLGDDKLATQIGNSLTFFTKQHVVK
jgi:hypothetical protein